MTANELTQSTEPQMVRQQRFKRIPLLGARIQSDVQTGTHASWGWLPALSLLSGIGLVLAAIGDTLGRFQVGPAELFFWLALLVLYTPVAIRLFSHGASRRERIGLVVMLALCLYLVKVLHSPIAFTFQDEFAHWRTASDIIQTKHLFHKNYVIPVSALYPALEAATVVVTSLSGLSVFSAGLIVLAVGRVVFALALFLLYEQISQSARLAGLASIFYMANPNYVFFISQFSYESLALPFAMLTLYTAVRRSRAQPPQRLALTLCLLLSLAATVMTHHLTSYALVGFLVVWSLILWFTGKFNEEKLGNLPLIAIAATCTWLIYVASLTLGYLAPALGGALAGLIRMIVHEETGRELFRSNTGQLSPLWERVTALATVGCILLILPIGILKIWWRQRTEALPLVLALTAIAYPGTLALRLSPSGWETANRSSEFIFVAIAFVLATGILHITQREWGQRAFALLFGMYATVIFVGGVIAGWSPLWRVPGSYIVSADTRSVEREGIDAAKWAGAHLGPENRVSSDRVNNLLMATYGQQQVVVTLSGGLNTSPIFFAPSIGPEEIERLQRGQVQYLVTDQRLTTQLPWTGYYYQPGDRDVYKYEEPLNPKLLEKFDHADFISRIFDSGNIAIFDTSALSGDAVPIAPQASPPEAPYRPLPILLAALILTLVLPGFALCAALFPRGSLDRANYILYGFGLSVIQITLINFVLTWTPWGLQVYSWTGTLIFLVGISLLIAFLRRNLPHPFLQFPRIYPGRPLWLVCGAVILVISALGVARVGAERQPATPFTQFWILPGSTQGTATIGIDNVEQRTMRYKLILNIDGTSVQEWSEITLEPGQQWQAVAKPGAHWDGSHPIDAMLYRLDAPNTVYRHGILWPHHGSTQSGVKP